jgi:4-amino-4-deoxy-L-arabinose transferase-like glycosyltransferase
MSRKTFLLALAAITAIGFGVRLGYLLIDERHEPASGDAVFYHRTANLLADGKGYIDPFRYDDGFTGSYERALPDGTTETVTVTFPPGIVQATAAHPPAWSYLLSVASRLGFDSETDHRAAGVLVGTLGVALIGLAGRELFGDRAGLVSAGIASVYGFLWLNDAALMSEPLVTVLVPVTTIVAVRWWRAPTWKAALWLGVLSAVGALIRTELLVYGPVLVAIGLAIGRRPRRELLRDLGITVAATLVVLSPWLIRNNSEFGSPNVTSSSGTVLVQTNCDPTYHGEKLGYWELECGQPEPVGPNGELLDEAGRDEIRREKALDYAKDHLGRLVTVAVPARVGRMFNLYDPVQTARFDIVVEQREFRLSVFSLVEYYLVVVAAVGGAAVAFRRRLPMLPILLWPALVAGIAAIGFGNNRYRVTAEPAFIWLAAFGAVTAWSYLGARRRRSAQPAQEVAPLA